MSSKLIKTDETYRSWIQEVSKRFRSSQIKAAVKTFSPRNLLYMHQFYRLFPEAGIELKAGVQADNRAITKQLVSQLSDVEIAQQDVSQKIPEDFKGSMPTIEEIEAELSDPEGGQDV